MNDRFGPIAILIGAIAFAGASTSTSDVPVTVHEWGTFTSIAGANGEAVEWLPQGGPSDLPCFVDRLSINTKGQLSGTVRMETPVLYFYAPRTAWARARRSTRQPRSITRHSPKS